MRADYLANYQQIAAEHVAQWNRTGTNPFQKPERVAALANSTAALVHKYSQPGEPVLDAGCGMGDLLSRIKGREARGVDFARPYLVSLVSRGIPADYGELEALPYRDSAFVVVTATDILEHVLDVNAVVAELLRVLRPGGHLIIRSPENEDLSRYLNHKYRFVHLRTFSEAGFRLLFTRVFDCEVIETVPILGERNVVVRKP